MDESEIPSNDYESENVDFHENICRSRSVSIKTKQFSMNNSIEDNENKKRRRIRNCLVYFIVFSLAAAGILVPIIVSMLKKPPIYYVSHPVTSKPVTMPVRTRMTTTTTTATPFDQCERQFVAITKNMDLPIILLAAADLNNDKKTDIVFMSESVANLYIVFNFGNNKFAEPIYYETDGLVASMIIADVNDDSNLDIILGLSRASYAVRIFLNSGDGTFYNMLNLTSDPDGIINSVAAADIDGDGISDIIIANANENIIGVYFYRGSNKFSDIKTYSVGRFPMSVAAADLNGDHKSDIIVANTKSDTISTLFNNDNGDFSDPINYSFGMGPLFVTSADMNNDHKPDIIVVNYFSSNVVIYFNNGTGNFNKRTNFSGVVNPLSVALVDYNSDGSIDIIVPNYHSNDVAVFFNDGYGGFGTSTSYLTYPLPRIAAAADLNNDNKPDIIIGNGNYLTVILSRCDY